MFHLHPTQPTVPRQNLGGKRLHGRNSKSEYAEKPLDPPCILWDLKDTSEPTTWSRREASDDGLVRASHDSCGANRPLPHFFFPRKASLPKHAFTDTWKEPSQISSALRESTSSRTRSLLAAGEDQRLFFADDSSLRLWHASYCIIIARQLSQFKASPYFRNMFQCKQRSKVSWLAY
jgi:hypothetical protein